MIKKALLLVIIFALILSPVMVRADADADADAISDKGLDYLRSQQETSGKISGFGGESQWAAIAFSENGVDVSNVKKSSSLMEYLLTDKPAAGAAATEWERRILAIVAIGSDPSDFGGVNYLAELEKYVNNHQLGQISQLNDDIFGLLALSASGTSVETRQDVLNFILAHQNSDGGFSYSSDPTVASDSNDTAAAIQAMQAAKNDGLSHENLENAIQNAKKYMLSLQVASGGFRYDFSDWSPDPDASSTAWALMALNVMGLSGSTEAINAKTWLLAQQEADGGFHWMSGNGSDTGTTSHALIALTGRGWIYVPKEPTPTTSPSGTPTAGITPTSAPIPTITNPPTATPTVAVCSDQKPGTPVISSAEIVDQNKVNLSWTKTENASYYLLAFGTAPDKFEFGDPDIRKNVTSYTVGSLNPGVTYYFKIRAGNGCSTGDYSNTAIVSIYKAGAIQPQLSPTPVSEVLGTTTEKNASASPALTPTLAIAPTANTNPSSNQVLMGFSMLSLLGALGYWYFKLR